MATIPDKIETWQMVEPTSKDKETGAVKPGKLANWHVQDNKAGHLLRSHTSYQ